MWQLGHWLTTAENQREKPIRKFSIDPASSIRTSIADPVFADPVSETPIEGSLNSKCFLEGFLEGACKGFQ